ncbi:hypothetical protein [Pseudoclavibacter sp. VKM Ac-2888]|uniref:hypothetical protein n=1 Tax=Pseudoclavibacter sp. VKM Ac-2888 TaxID=2783830 RepID=UPI001889C7CE|nr:hypothetical protein [Pseudoclavibacter sp. VKM Ac-2888]MBF4549325.1 hypothetical protein [Pseudoclavibacter sp. VKM Ac-2888]
MPTRLLAVTVAVAWTANESVNCKIDETLAQYPARPASGGDVAARIVQALADEQVLQSDDLANKMVSVVWNIILGEFGQRVKIRGWITGHFTGAEGNYRKSMELTGRRARPASSTQAATARSAPRSAASTRRTAAGASMAT